MEFDKNTNDAISDEARLKAETKQVTLQPIHGNVAPEDIPDAEVAAHHLNAGPIANSPNDTEQTDKQVNTRNVHEPAQKPPVANIVTVSIIALCGLSSVALIFMVS